MVDASQRILAQYSFNRQVANASWPLTKTECKYAERMKQTLALSHAVKKNSFIYGTPLLAETDHKPCTAIAKIGLINISWRGEIFFFFQLQMYALQIQ